MKISTRISSYLLTLCNLLTGQQQDTVLKLLEDSRKLTNELNKFKLAVDNTSDMVVITNTEGVSVYYNKATERITGYSVEEAIGKKAGTLWKTPMPKEYYANFWHTIKDLKQTFSGEIKNRRKNGEVYDAFISVTPVLDNEGKIIFFVGLERDITKEKNIDRAKTEFVSLASHQLRTPLATINWYAEMVLDGDVGVLNDEQKKYVGEIYTANQRMVTLVNALLNVSRLEMGTFIVEPEPTNLCELADKAIGEQLSRITTKRLKVEKHCDSDLPIMNVDPKLMFIVFQNIFSNAAKYTPEDGTISWTITRNDPVLKNGQFVDQEYLLIKISDTGLGIPAEAKDKIFSKLYRADNARATEPEGTGLGLYLAKSIIENSGGHIWFESTEGQGTIFFIVIPTKGMERKTGTKSIS